MIIYAIISGQVNEPKESLYFQQFDGYAIAKAENQFVDGWEVYDTSEELNIRRDELEAMNTPEYREGQLETLTTAFDAFIGLIEDEPQRNELQSLAKALFYDNRKVMIAHVVSGGSGLKDFFANYEQGWLDLKAVEDKPSPREYALSILSV